jgi:ribosome biogenesis GTPase A
MLARLSRNKPGIKLLNKSDMSEAGAVEQWQQSLQTQSEVRCLPCSRLDQAINQLPSLCREMIPQRTNRSNMIYAMIAGIPNVGKSTLINQLAGRSIAKTGNEAALTRMQQRIEISPQLTLIDTPGMLWPNIINENSGYRLAATGAIRDTALELQDVGAFIAEFFLRHYPQRLIQRYDIAELPQSEIEVLEVIAKRRGCLVSGGHVDFEKVSRLLINEFRSGDLGQACLETPQQYRAEQEQSVVIHAQKTERKAAKKAARQAKRQKR